MGLTLFNGRACLGVVGDYLSIPYLNEAIAYPVSTVYEKVVLILLCNRANNDGYCWPSIETICREGRISKSSALRAIRGLEAIGVLNVRRMHRVSNGYQIKFLGCPIDTQRVSNKKSNGVRQTPQPSGRTITKPILSKSEEEKKRFAPLSESAQKELDDLKNSLREASVEYKCSAL